MFFSILAIFRKHLFSVRPIIFAMPLLQFFLSRLVVSLLILSTRYSAFSHLRQLAFQ